MTSITAVQGDITTQHVDVIVNAANERMRGGGGVDGAIHRAGGPAILQECIERFPNGLATGDAGWTTAGDLAANWVVHTVGPNYAAGQHDPSLLASCYRRSLEVADELGARTVAFPLVSAGIYGWPLGDAIRVAVATIEAAHTHVEEVRIVVLDGQTYQLVNAVLLEQSCLRILRAVKVLHDRGYHGVRVMPGMSPSGIWWRVAIAPAKNLTTRHGYPYIEYTAETLGYSTAAGSEFAGREVTLATPIDDIADLILTVVPQRDATYNDPEYARWYAGLVDVCERQMSLPVAYSDSHNPPPGWEIGWGSGVTYPAPPDPPRGARQ